MNVGLTLVLAFVFLAVAGLFIVIAKTRLTKKQKQRVLDMIDARAASFRIDPNGNEAVNKAVRALSQRDISTKLKKAAQEQKAEHNTKSLTSIILQAGFEFSVARFWVVSILLGMGTFIVLWNLTSLSPLIVGLLTFFALFGFPRFVLKFIAKRRQKAFLTDFADALEGMMRLMKSGMPVAETIAMVSREFEGPIGEEMARVYHMQKLGTPMADAVRKLVPRMPLAEVQMFATAIAIQQQTGSSLSEVLGNLAGVIRARFRLKRKVQALSSEAKISAMIIACLPVVVSLGLWAANPDYISLLFTDSTGKMVLTGALCWMSLGVFAMRQMINFKV